MKMLRMLGAATATLVAGALLLGATAAFADSPPSPPSRFVGTVTINGQTAPDGTTVTAQINGANCGTGTVTGGNYKVDVAAFDPGQTVACGKDGDTVTFLVNGTAAAQTGTWHNYTLGQVNLTVTTSTSTATPTQSATPSGTATTAPSTSTPKPPVTGSGTGGTGSSAPMWLFALIGLGAVAFGVGGVAAAKRK